MAFLDWLATVKKSTTEGVAIPPELRSRLSQDPYYRLRSLSEVQAAASLGIRIDVNQASVDDWLRLPGLSIHQARLLVQLRQGGVEFHCVDDIAAALGVPVSMLQPLEPILQFCYYGETAELVPFQVDVNTATVDEFTQIPGLELFLARAIVQNRQYDGRYHNLADLQKRLYLPGDVVAKLMHYLRF